MGKLYTPENVASGFQTNNSLNDNFAQIEYALDACLARTGDAPNNMLADLDMDSHDILNVGTIDADILLVDGAQVPSLQDVQDAFTTGQATLDSSIATAQTAIDASVTAAQTAETNAETAETNAESAQTAAEAAQAAAEAAAAGVNLPTIQVGDAGKQLYVKADETGYELDFANTVTSATAGTGGDYATVVEAISYFISQGRTSTGVAITVLDTGALDNGGLGTNLTGINGWLTLSTSGTVSGAVTATNLMTFVNSNINFRDFDLQVTGGSRVLIGYDSDFLFTTTSTLQNDATSGGSAVYLSNSSARIGFGATVTFASDDSYIALEAEGSHIRMGEGVSSKLVCTGRARLVDGAKVDGGSMVITHDNNLESGLSLFNTSFVFLSAELEINQLSTNTSPDPSLFLSFDSRAIASIYDFNYPNATLNTTTHFPIQMNLHSHITTGNTFSVEDNTGAVSPTYDIQVADGSAAFIQSAVSTISAKNSSGFALTKNSFNSGDALWVSD